MKPIAIIASLAFMCLASGCAQISSGINSVTGALSSPSANTAIANLKAGGQALLCAVANTAAVSGAIANAVNANQAIIRDSQNIYVISSDLCTVFGGKVVSTVTLPASAVTK